MDSNSAAERAEDPRAQAAELATHGCWSEAVYRDLLALKAGALTEQEFRARHQWRRAILVLDLEGFTRATEHLGDVPSLLRVLDAQEQCLPVLRKHGAVVLRCFADDMVALYENPEDALDAALAVRARFFRFLQRDPAERHLSRCCIAIGYGDVLAVGPNRAQGAEMNRVSKLGEDIAGPGDILLTDGARAALRERRSWRFERTSGKDAPFPYHRVLDRFGERRQSSRRI